MRILILNWKDIDHPAVGGAEVFTHEVARRWVGWGHEVTVFSGAAADTAPEANRDGVRLVRRGTRFTVYREAQRYWHEVAQRQGFDVVVDEVNTRPFLSPRWLGQTPIVALVYQVAKEVWFHEFPLPVALAGRFWFERRWLRSYADVPTLTICQSAAAALSAIGIRSVSVVPVGLEVPTNLPRPAKEADPTVIFVGRLTANKRPDAALDAFAQVASSTPSARMWVVGSGPLEGQLRQRWESDRVRFFGRVDERTKYDLMARAHVQLVTSVREGWGMVVSEAAAVGTPSVAFDVPGLRESVPPSGGVLVKPTTAALAAELEQVLTRWTSEPPVVSAGGVAPWDEVATVILGHLERALRYAARS